MINSKQTYCRNVSRDRQSVAYKVLAVLITYSVHVQGVMILGLGGWFRHNSVASVPAPLLRPFGKP